MKKILFSFLAVFIMANANAADGTKTYRDALKECDKKQETELSKNVSTNDVKEVVLNASNCYVKVGKSVIKKYYSATYEETMDKFVTFSNSIYSASLNLYSGPDECYPECGQLSYTMRMNMTELFIKKYILDMLNYIDKLDI